MGKKEQDSRQDNIKICMIGLGSIGKRHIKNLVKVLQSHGRNYTIDALRSSKRELPEEVEQLIAKEYYSYHDLPSDYDIIFITNPTSEHYAAIEKAASKSRALFIEKPLFEHARYDWKELPLQKEGIYYVACPLRHKSMIQYVKNRICKEEKIYAARAVSSSYLPAWRTGVDYRQIYSAKKELGGGVALDLIHEWDYLTYLFGMPGEIKCIQGHFSNLEINCEDVACYIAGYADKTIEVHLDYFGRKSTRKLELYCENQTIVVDLLENRIRFEADDPALERTVEFPEEDLYVNEIQYFYNVVIGKQENMNTIEHASKILKLAYIDKE